VHLRPAADSKSAYAEKVKLRARRQAQYRACATSRSGHQRRHADRSDDECRPAGRLPHLAEAGADGIGLFRTELQFMIAATLPRTSEQDQLYRSVLDAAGEGEARYLPHARYRRRQGAALSAPVEEENPALGWRAIRLGSTGRACCARRCARCSRLPAGGS
jgi:phosphotransferase system enzyme I (PtsP)